MFFPYIIAYNLEIVVVSGRIVVGHWVGGVGVGGQGNRKGT